MYVHKNILILGNELSTDNEHCQNNSDIGQNKGFAYMKDCKCP